MDPTASTLRLMAAYIRKHADGAVSVVRVG